MRTPVMETCSGSMDRAPRFRMSIFSKNSTAHRRTPVERTSNGRLNVRLNYNSKVKQASEIAPAQGKLGVLLVGLGAVSTTTIAGVLAIRKGLAQPIGSLTQMGTVRLGKRTEGRSPKITEVVALSSLDDLVFGGCDIFEDVCHAAARTTGVIGT